MRPSGRRGRARRRGRPPGSWCRSPTSATRAPCSSAMVSSARAVSWSSIPASSTSSRSPRTEQSRSSLGPRVDERRCPGRRSPACRRVQRAVVVPAEAVLVGEPRRRGRVARRVLVAATWAALSVGVTTTSRPPGSLDRGACCGQRGGLAGAGRALHDHQLIVAGQRGDDRRAAPRRGRRRASSATGVAASFAGALARAASRAARSASTSSTCREVSARTCSGTPSRSSSGTHVGERAGGQVLGQFAPDRGVGDDVAAGDELLDLAADVGGVPRRPARRRAATTPRRRPALRSSAPTGSASIGAVPDVVAVAERVQFVDPALGQFRAVAGHDLVRAGVGPGARVPRPPQRRARLLTRVGGAPLGLVAVDVARRSAPRGR